MNLIGGLGGGAGAVPANNNVAQEPVDLAMAGNEDAGGPMEMEEVLGEDGNNGNNAAAQGIQSLFFLSSHWLIFTVHINVNFFFLR